MVYKNPNGAGLIELETQGKRTLKIILAFWHPMCLI